MPKSQRVFGRKHKQAHGWRDGNKYFLSVAPRHAKAAVNVYNNAIDAVSDASKRRMSVHWEDPKAIDG